MLDDEVVVILCFYLASKKLQTLNDEISKADKQIGRLDEEITTARRRILSLRHGSKNDQMCCEELNANVKDLQSRAKQLRLDRRKVYKVIIEIHYSYIPG